MWHRDSLGTSVVIKPGEVNLMTAGRGIVHSERETGEAKARRRDMFGIQAWLALPKDAEETAPAFAHHGLGALPRIEGEGKRVRLVMGEAFGARSPVEFPHATLYAEAVLAPGAVLPLDPDYDERAIFVASGEIDIAGERFEAGRLLVFRPGDRISILATSNARLMLLGGEPMDGPRHMWWNFVSSSRDRIEAAKADWQASRFPLVPGDEVERVPLPG
jgi:redox-sensitive bicupin YhaK (pirin superfamily)